MWKLFYKKNKYVVWDGYTEKEYKSNSKEHDYTFLYDSGIVSIQKVRNEALMKGCIPTIIMACKRGEVAHEIVIDGKWRGIFTYFYNKVTYTQNYTFRECIKRINELIRSEGIPQTCEIICRTDILDRKMNFDAILNEKHIVAIFDMCRS